MDHPQRALSKLRDTATLSEVADALYWLELHGLQVEDLKRAIMSACRREGGATPGEIVQHVIQDHGFMPEDEDHIRWFIALFAVGRAITPVGTGRRFYCDTPAPRALVGAFVAMPPEEFEAIRPYIFRGRPVWLMGE